MVDKNEFTIEEVANGLKVPPSRVYQWIKEKKMNGYLLKGIVPYNVETSDLIEFMQKNKKYKSKIITLLRERKVGIYVETPSVFSGIPVTVFPVFLRSPRCLISLLKSKKVSGENQYFLRIGDWEAEFDIALELRRRLEVLKNYRRKLEIEAVSEKKLERLQTEIKEIQKILQRWNELEEIKCATSGKETVK